MISEDKNVKMLELKIKKVPYTPQSKHPGCPPYSTWKEPLNIFELFKI
jgi:hypothetical protein